MPNITYTDQDMAKAKNMFKPGTKVLSPMTGKSFVVERIDETWHKEYIKGFNGRHFFDVVWFNGVFASEAKQYQ